MSNVLTPDEAEELISKNPRNRDVLFPYLNGEDLNSRPDQSPSRWVINFHDWPLERAETYSDCWKIIEERVRAERQRKGEDGHYVLRSPLPQRYWQYGDKRPALYAAIAGMDCVLAIPETTKFCTFSICRTGIVFSHMIKVVALEDIASFAILASTLHEVWARSYSSTLATRLKYSPSDCFETFPFPSPVHDLEHVGRCYHAHRQSVMLTRDEGLTKTYNRIHDPRETVEDIAKLRDLHVEMDYAVAAAYGWDDLDLGHDFHETKQGMRYTISDESRREVLGRLLALNHEQYEQEVALGLHNKGTKKSVKGTKERISSQQIALGF